MIYGRTRPILAVSQATSGPPFWLSGQTFSEPLIAMTEVEVCRGWLERKSVLGIWTNRYAVLSGT
jgi:hypothetical protein